MEIADPVTSEATRAPIKVLAIVGPTATGKSEVAARLARLVDGEIVSADSMQVYEKMDIGTAKPTAEILALAPHHLIGFIDPSQDYSVAQFQAAARGVIEEIRKRRRLPIIVGGSGLYVRSIIDPLDFPAGEPHSRLRSELAALGRGDPAALVERLRKIDPQAAAGVDTKNTRRVITAIEAAMRGAEAYEDRQARWRKRAAVHDAVIVGLRMPRERLNALIDARVDEMIEAGLEDEVRQLAAGPKNLSVTAAQALGYKEFSAHFEGRLTREEAIELIKRRTRQFAKRQMTWFKADPRVVW
ncbi:MAG: tRNA (adenosine(37)-N6)-dimethylallyltransferase MiaA, partial [Actinomycetota bacterium]|nr:tRNA (adenosine(37)-N6)-dimethylallyltransferase MiaA [Actinomycetota bacterium]